MLSVGEFRLGRARCRSDRGELLNGSGITLRKIVQQVFGLFLEVFQARVCGQNARHYSSFFMARRPLWLGRREVMLDGTEELRWDHPFPRTGCNLDCGSSLPRREAGQQLVRQARGLTE